MYINYLTNWQVLMHIQHSSEGPMSQIHVPSFAMLKVVPQLNEERHYLQKEMLKRQYFVWFCLHPNKNQTITNEMRKATRDELKQKTKKQNPPRPISSASMTCVCFAQENLRKFNPSSWYGCSEPSFTPKKCLIFIIIITKAKQKFAGSKFLKTIYLQTEIQDYVQTVEILSVSFLRH